MRKSLNIDDTLLNEVKGVTGLPDTATVEEVLRHFVNNEQHRRDWQDFRSIGWPTFEALAFNFRASTAECEHTPAERLMREA